MSDKNKRIKPGPDQESVWDYPRPPALETTDKRIQVKFGGNIIADTTGAYRVLETSHPPVYYLPPDDIDVKCLKQVTKTSYCEWKGRARYYDVASGGQRAAQAAWSYPEPKERFADITDYIAFYPHMMDACYVGDEEVKAQEGSFYGGWITSDIVGPFKGGQGTAGW